MAWPDDIVATALTIGADTFKRAKWLVLNGPSATIDVANDRL